MEDMLTYIPNPKLEGSNIVACVPQDGFCSVQCRDCFFNRPENYLGPEPQSNMPPVEITEGKIVRVNDVNDSNNQRERVLGVTRRYKDRFYNTSRPKDLEGFEYPVVFTANPKEDEGFYGLDPIPKNLMYVRARVNVWNEKVVDGIVQYYTSREVPVILTYMAYYETPIPFAYKQFYEKHVRTLNKYWCVKPVTWWGIFERYERNDFVFTCGVAPYNPLCQECGTCEELYKVKIRRLGLPSAFNEGEIEFKI